MHQESVVGVLKRVLLLLDDPGLGVLIGLDLAVTGHVVDIARNADRARELVERHAYGVVIVDLRLCGSAEALEGEGPVFQVIAPNPPDPEPVLRCRHPRRARDSTSSPPSMRSSAPMGRRGEATPV